MHVVYFLTVTSYLPDHINWVLGGIANGYLLSPNVRDLVLRVRDVCGLLPP